MNDYKNYPVAKAITERRTVREFKNDPVCPDLIRELLDISTWAPNHKWREPWRFIVYTGDGSKIPAYAITRVPNKGGKMKMDPKAYREQLEKIPCHIVVITPEAPGAKEREEDYAAACALIQNFQLAAWERGLGVVWKTDGYISSAEFRSAAGAQPGEKIVGLLQVGYPKNIPDPHYKTPLEEKLTLIDSDAGAKLHQEYQLTLTDENVFYGLPAMTRKEAVSFAGSQLKSLGHADDYFVESMHEKEGFKNTYLGNGVAAPHGSKEAKSRVKNSGAVIMHYPAGIEYGGETVYILIAIAAQKEIHMQILAAAAKISENAETVKHIVTAQNKEEFIKRLTQAM